MNDRRQGGAAVCQAARSWQTHPPSRGLDLLRHARRLDEASKPIPKVEKLVKRHIQETVEFSQHLLSRS